MIPIYPKQYGQTDGHTGVIPIYPKQYGQTDGHTRVIPTYPKQYGQTDGHTGVIPIYPKQYGQTEGHTGVIPIYPKNCVCYLTVGILTHWINKKTLYCDTVLGFNIMGWENGDFSVVQTGTNPQTFIKYIVW